MKLLRIDSSARRDSVSRQLTSEFAVLWKQKHPEGEVVEQDLATHAFSTISDDWISANRAPSSQWTDRQQEAILLSDFFTAELMAADTIVIGTPMHNFSISWPLKAWIDQVVRIGKTVVYDQQGPRGLLQGKRVVVISSRGGSYRPGTHRAHLDFLEPYLRTVLGFIGLTDITFIDAENQYRPDRAAAGKAAAQQQIAQVVAEFAALRITHQ